MDKRKSFLNVSISIGSRVILLFAALFARRLLIRYIGNEVNGLNSLYNCIIGMLAVAELGVGSAIVFSMYRPIVAGDKRQVAALYCLYRKLYRVIAGVIFAGGILVMPFLPRLIGDYESVTVDVYSTFFIMLVSVVLTYLYGAKTSLIAAHKDNYITTGILTIARLIRYGLQIASILICRSFTVYLLCLIAETLIMWALTEAAVRRRHGGIIGMKEAVDRETKSEIVRNVRAMFMHKIGNMLVNTIDSLIISGFIGVAVLGKYSNYTVIAGIITSIIVLFFTPLTSVVGHLCAGGDREKSRKYFEYFYCLNYILGVIFYMGYYAVIDDIVTICFGAGLEVSRAIAFIITVNEFTRFMRKTPLLFRDASGAFYYDRWKPIAEGLGNLALSLLFVQIFPREYRIVGVIAATIITTLLICDIVDPFVVFKHVFAASPAGFYIRNYCFTGLFVCALAAATFLRTEGRNPAAGFLINGFKSVIISACVIGTAAAFDKAFRQEALTMGREAARYVRRALQRRSA